MPGPGSAATSSRRGTDAAADKTLRIQIRLGSHSIGESVPLLGTPMSGATTTGGRFVELQSATGARGDGHPATFPGASSFIGDTVPIDGFVLGRIVSYLKSEGPEEVEAWLGSLYRHGVTLRCMAHVARKLDMPDLQEIVVAQTIAQTSHVRYDDVLRCWSEQGLGSITKTLMPPLCERPDEDGCPDTIDGVMRMCRAQKRFISSRVLSDVAPAEPPALQRLARGDGPLQAMAAAVTCGANPYAADDGLTPLHTAVQHRNEGAVAYLATVTDVNVDDDDDSGVAVNVDEQRLA